jgi:hypothetical protein
VLWVWLNGGALAFALLLALFAHAMLVGFRMARLPLEPLLRSWAITAAAAVPMVFLFAWGDLGLTNIRVLMVLGVAMGVISAIHNLEKSDRPAPTSPA